MRQQRRRPGKLIPVVCWNQSKGVDDGKRRRTHTVALIVHVAISLLQAPPRLRVIKFALMRIAIAQLNQVVGDLAGNAARILDATAASRRAGADLVVTPELSLCGYPPEDLLLRPAFLDACAREIQRLAEAVQGPTLLVGFPQRSEERRVGKGCRARRAVVPGNEVSALA